LGAGERVGCGRFHHRTDVAILGAVALQMRCEARIV
jgi:hypothetical protein